MAPDDFDAEPCAEEFEAREVAVEATAAAPGVGPSSAALAPLLDDDQLAELILRIVERDQGALAEEVVEGNYWQVWRHAPRFDPDRGRPVTWSLAMARSRAIDALRRDQRFVHDGLPEDDTADAAGAAPPPQELLD